MKKEAYGEREERRGNQERARHGALMEGGGGAGGGGTQMERVSKRVLPGFTNCSAVYLSGQWETTHRCARVCFLEWVWV